MRVENRGKVSVRARNGRRQPHAARVQPCVCCVQGVWCKMYKCPCCVCVCVYVCKM